MFIFPVTNMQKRAIKVEVGHKTKTWAVFGSVVKKWSAPGLMDAPFA